MRLLPIGALLSIALLSLTISTMTGSGYTGPTLQGNGTASERWTSPRTMPAQELAVPAPTAGAGAPAQDVLFTATDELSDKGPGASDLVLSEPQAVAPRPDGKTAVRVGIASVIELIHDEPNSTASGPRIRRVRRASAPAAGSGAQSTGVTAESTALAAPAPPSPTVAAATATASTASASGGPGAPANAVAPTAATATAIPSSTPTPTSIPPTATATPDAAAAAATATAQALVPSNETVVSINTPTPTKTSTPPPAATKTSTPTPTRTPTSVPPTSTPTASAPTPTPAPGALLTLDRIIATRGDHMLPHEIRHPEPMYSTYSWGQHGTEDTKAISGSHSVNLWLGVSRDASQLDTSLGVKVNIRNIRGYVYQASTGTWVEVANGLPTWSVSFDNLPPFNYYDITPTYEADGSQSFDVPPGRGLHMSTNAPGLRIAESNGVVSIVEARLLGTPAAIAATKLGMGAGADFRDAAGSGGSIQQSGAGQLGLLTGNWKAFAMLSSTLSDGQVRLSPPPLP